MKFNSKYFDSIRINSKSKKSKEPEPVPDRTCQWEECDKPGSCRAPMGRLHEGKYLYFCVDHVKEYNKNFNYFSGLQPQDIAKFQKDAITGHRPTWPLRSNEGLAHVTAKNFSALPSGSAAYQNKLRRAMGYDDNLASNPSRLIRKLKPLEEKALLDLGLTAKATKNEIKVKYKQLVKEFHPDTNGGDRSSEEKFLSVLQAYKILQKAGIV